MHKCYSRVMQLAGDVKAADAFAKAALRISPDNTEAMYERAVVHFMRGRIQEGLALFKAVVDADFEKRRKATRQANPSSLSEWKARLAEQDASAPAITKWVYNLTCRRPVKDRDTGRKFGRQLLGLSTRRGRVCQTEAPRSPCTASCSRTLHEQLFTRSETARAIAAANRVYDYQQENIHLDDKSLDLNGKLWIFRMLERIRRSGSWVLFVEQYELCVFTRHTRAHQNPRPPLPPQCACTQLARTPA